MNPLKKITKRVKFYLTEPYLDRQSNVRFIHQKPTHRNIGDDLCSPKHYFNFVAKQKVNIFGGGVEDKFYLQFIKNLGLDAKLSVLWGVGQSIKKKPNPQFVESLPFKFWGLRDIDSVQKNHFLPCVSCLHPMLDSPINNNNKLIFINFDPSITTDYVKNNLLNKYNDIEILYNNCSDRSFRTALLNSQHIITNSFHGAYWGLLSGREVSLIGYSTKFTSLYKMFNLDVNKIIKVDRGCEKSLLNAIDTALTGRNKQHIEENKEFLNKFRSLNIDFADKLSQSELFEKVELRK